MAFLPYPTSPGVYRVKVFDTDKDSYWKYMPTPSPSWIQRTTLEESSIQFQWNIAPIQGRTDSFTIVPAYDPNFGIVSSTGNNEEKYWGYGYPIAERGPSAVWTIKSSGNFSKLYYESGASSSYPLDSVVKGNAARAIHFYESDDTAKNQRWVFQFVAPLPITPPPSVTSGSSFESLFFTLTPQAAAQEKYDIIVVGTGIGGGVIASDLFDTNSRLGEGAKSVLVIEKGGLAFHSHCLNASRPTGFGEDRAQQNDQFFSLFKNQYTFPEENKDWKGGPMYNLGGRSAAWGLFAPRIHDEPLYEQFAPKTGLADALINKWYAEAESLMNLSLPATTTTHQNLMERLNIKNQRGCQWQWGRIASEFRDEKNFDFAAGAYSTIDKLLEIAMSKERKPDRTTIEHKNWKILLHTDVREVVWDTDTDKVATGVKVRGPDGALVTIGLKDGGSVVLAAGSVHSPAILMRSGKEDFLKGNGGLHLTDHDIFAKGYTFRYKKPADRDRIGSMKLQTYVRPKSGKIVLANLAVDASSFLPRDPVRITRVNETFPMLTIAFIRQAPLNRKNTIVIKDDEPVVTINRFTPFNHTDPTIRELRELTTEVISVIKEALSIEILSATNEDQDEFFKVLELGGVAHELGTIPTAGAPREDDDDKDIDPHNSYCLDTDLKLRGHEGIYVCDLSVFPWSPEVNPTLTLAALALRLSRTVLLPRVPPVIADVETIHVMNQTGENIRVFVSNTTDANPTEPLSPEKVILLKGKSPETNLPEANPTETLRPGQVISRKRTVPEAVLVYRLKYNSTDQFLDEPVLFVAHPGQVLAI